MQVAQSTYDHTFTKRTTLRKHTSQVHTCRNLKKAFQVSERLGKDVVKNVKVWYEKIELFKSLLKKKIVGCVIN